MNAPESQNLALFDKTLKSIERDLVTSPTRLGLTYAAGSLAGYFASLAICAQCSVGLTPVAWHTASILHQIPDPWCPFVCGAIFGIAPVIGTLLFFNRFQHRYLLYRMWWLVVALPIIVSVSFAFAANPHDLEWNLSWLVTAIAVPYLFEVGTGFLLRQSRWKELKTT